MDTDDQRWLGEKSAGRCVENRNINEFDSHSMPDLRTVATAISDGVAAFESFGFGGSDTTR